MTGAATLDYGYREETLEHAARVQRQLLPRSVPAIPGYEFFAYYQAAHSVGGDYYDFISLSDDRLAIVVGDVSGKDVPAALIGARFAGDTRNLISSEAAPAQAAIRFNKRFYNAGLDERFITLSRALSAEVRRFIHCSAGHPPLLLRRTDGSVEEHYRSSVAFRLGSCLVPSTSRRASS